MRSGQGKALAEQERAAAARAGTGARQVRPQGGDSTTRGLAKRPETSTPTPSESAAPGAERESRATTQTWPGTATVKMGACGEGGPRC